jgi:hypothetical protein
MKVGDIEDDNAAVWFLQAYDVRGITGLVTVFVIIQGKTVRIFVTTVGSRPTLSAGRKILVAAKAAHYRRSQCLVMMDSND